MATKKHRTAPDPELTGWPGGTPYIVGNEACERFSFYGMKSMLIPYLTTLYIAAAVANHALMTQDVAGKKAAFDVHMFVAGVYALPVIGAILADKLLGKYLTIMSLSLVYCVGHLVLALMGESLHGVHVGLLLISIGSGGIKACVSAHLGDQFGKSNWRLTKHAFQAFYFAVNFGSIGAELLMPWMLQKYGYAVAFGLPGVLMLMATIVFWSGRYKFIHVPPNPGKLLGALDAASATLLFVGALGSWMFGGSFDLSGLEIALIAVGSLAAGLALFLYRQKLQPDDGFLAVLVSSLVRGGQATRKRLGDEAYDGMWAVFRVISVIAFVSVFWSLFDQKDTTWLLQANHMDLTFHLPFGIEFTMLAAQTQSWNAMLVLILIPVFTFVLFPWMEKSGIKITPLRRMAVGMLLAPASFAFIAYLQGRIAHGEKLHVAWQLIPYVLITTSEILVSATGLEFAYSQAPRRMKSTVMGFWQLTVSFGNLFAAHTIEKMTDRPLGELFWIFAGLMAGVAVLFTARAAFYKYRDYPQE